MTLDVRDQIIQQHVPTVMVPSHSELPRQEEWGHRYLVARDGLWIEVWYTHLHILWPIAPTPMPLPYGTLQRYVRMAFGKLSDHVALLREFLADARAALPNECAGVLVWSELDGMLTYQRCESLQAGPGSVRYKLPVLKDHEYIAVDLHSHGTMPAFFSATDDADDAGSVKVAGVIGNLDAPQPSAEFRLCVLGMAIAAPVPEGLFK